MTTITYRCSQHPYLRNPPGQQKTAAARPCVEVEAWWNGKGPHRVVCLVDTGADFTILDGGTAWKLGIVPVQLPQRRFQLGDGTWVTMGERTGVQLNFAGTNVSGTVLFGGAGTPILGRDFLLDHPKSLDLGFDARGWHHT